MQSNKISSLVKVLFQNFDVVLRFVPKFSAVHLLAQWAIGVLLSGRCKTYSSPCYTTDNVHRLLQIETDVANTTAHAKVLTYLHTHLSVPVPGANDKHNGDGVMRLPLEALRHIRCTCIASCQNAAQACYIDNIFGTRPQSEYVGHFD